MLGLVLLTLLPIALIVYLMIGRPPMLVIASDFETIYPFISAYPGLFGGFVSGSEVSAITMSMNHHFLMSKRPDGSTLIVAAAMALWMA
ncbi:MAG: hypothetical protein AB2L22_11105 [Syntrophales bacterium]